MADSGSSASIGLRVRTARAVAVILGGSPGAPEVLDRREVSLWSPEVPESRQPFHAGLGRPPHEAEPVIERACEAARGEGARAVRSLLTSLEERGLRATAAALVVRSDSDPSKLRNDHIRAHAAEGRLFREVLEAGAEACGLPHVTLLERLALGEASNALGRSPQELKHLIADLGKSVGSPWRADEKAACLAAWIALVTGRS
jgi:hypothetical protein